MIHIESMEPRRLMDAGSLDTSFGSGGHVDFTVPGGHTLEISDMDVDPQGDIVLTGRDIPVSGSPTINPSGVLFRRHADGSAATWFGNHGKLILPSNAVNRLSTRVTEQGAILVAAGDTLYKFTASGKRDSSFGRRGKLTFPQLGGFTYDVDPQGRIYVTGPVNGANLPHNDIELLRLNPDGSPDTGYSPDLSLLGNVDNLQIKVLRDGKLLASTRTETTQVNDVLNFTAWTVSVVRLKTDGHVDTSYGTGGKAAAVFSASYPNDLAFSFAAGQTGVTDDGYVMVTFQKFDAISGTPKRVENRMDAIDPAGTLHPNFITDETTKNRVQFLSEGSFFAVASLVEETGPRFLDANGAVIPGISAAVENSAKLPQQQQRFGPMAIANDGTLLLLNQTTSQTTVRLFRLFRDDSPAGQPFVRTLTKVRDAAYRFKVQWRDDDGIDRSTLGDNDITITLPNGKRRRARLVSIDATTNAKVINATYRVTSPDGEWNSADNGRYGIRIERNSVRDINGNAAARRTVGQFTVQIPAIVMRVMSSSPFATSGLINGAVSDTLLRPVEQVGLADVLIRSGDAIR